MVSQPYVADCAQGVQQDDCINFMQYQIIPILQKSQFQLSTYKNGKYTVQ